MVVALRNIVDGHHAAIISVPCPAFLTHTKFADVLISLVHAVTTDLAMVTALNKDTAAANLISPAIAG